VKRTSRDEPIGVVMHICMETTQGNSLCSYLCLKLAKKPGFSFYILCFFFYKNLKKGSARGVGFGTSGSRAVAGKGIGG
jgi:hypothetical protein